MKTSFQELLVLAWKTSLSCKRSWVFGLLVAFAIVKENFLLAPFSETSSFEGTFASLVQSFNSPAALIGVVIGIAILRLFGKSNLIVVLEASSKKNHSSRISFLAMASNFFRAVLFQIAAALLLLCILAVLFLPVWLAFVYNQQALGGVAVLSIVTGLAILPVFFFVVEFAFFYFLLSRIRLAAAFENGLALFSRHIGRSILFGIFYLSFLVVFTFCLNLVMLTIVVFSGKTGVAWFETASSFFGSLLFITWFSIIEQAMRLFFFKDLASPRDEEKKEAELVVAERSPEFPPA